MISTKVLMILFDGAEWNVIRPLLQAGSLPNFAALMRAGSYGPLRSLEGVALASPILWTSMASGKMPAKHGVKDFFDTAQSVQCTRLWEIFEHDGLPIGLFRYLITWPPRQTKGFIVPDWCARTPDTYPAELGFINRMSQARDWRSLLRNGALAARHGMRLKSALRAGREAIRERIGRRSRLDVYAPQRLVELAIHTDVFVRLVRRHQPYYATFYSGLPDAVHHQYWKFMEPEKFNDVSPAEVRRYGPAIPRTYDAIDRALGRLLRLAGPETFVVVASDHGGEANVLEEYRWADVRGDDLVRILGLSRAMSAFRIGSRTYLRLRPAATLAETIDEIAERVRGATLVGSSAPLFEVEVSGSDEMSVKVVYLKQSMDGARIQFRDGRTFPAGELLNLTPTISGNHSMHGILLVRGPGVRRNNEIDGASLLDVTPTVLALLGRAVGRDMDGHVLIDAIEPEFLRRTPVTYIDSYDEVLGRREGQPPDDSTVGMDEVQARLRALGYID